MHSKRGQTGDLGFRPVAIWQDFASTRVSLTSTEHPTASTSSSQFVSEEEAVEGVDANLICSAALVHFRRPVEKVG